MSAVVEGRLQGEPAAPDAAPGGLEPRLHAFAVDRSVDLGAPLAVGWTLAATGQGAGVVVGGVLATVVVLLLALAGLLGTRGTSPGLALTRLRLVRDGDLGAIGFGPALKRQAVLLLAGAPTFGLGWATLAWTAVTDPSGLRRGWHDQLAGSVVVDPSPAPVVEVAHELPQQIVNLTALRLAPAEPEPVRSRPARSGAGGPAVVAPTGRVTPATPAPAGAGAPAQDGRAGRSVPGVPATAANPQPAAVPAPAVPAAGAAAPEAPAAVRRPGRRRAGVPTSGPAAAGPVVPADQPVRSAPPPPPTRAPAAAAAPAADPAPAATAPGASGWTVRLDTGEELPVDGLTLLGRGPQPRAGESVSRLVPLSSADMSVSKTHAQLQLAGDGTLVVMDRGSTNGSVVVRRGVPRHLSPGRPTTLLDGDVLRLGDRTLEVSRRG